MSDWAAHQARWDESLRQRAAIDPHSQVPLLDNLLAPFRAEPTGSAPGRAGEKTISQTPPDNCYLLLTVVRRA
jgi:hypothetical protein